MNFLVAPIKEVNNDSVFKLSQDPVDLQISVHFQNLISYFRDDNMHGRCTTDKFHYHDTSQVLEAFHFFLINPDFLSNYLNKRYDYPIEFRICQIIEHYGVDRVKNYIKMIYGRSI